MPDFDPTERELHNHLGEPTAGEHPSFELLLASGQDILPPEVESRLQAHLRGCTLCTSLLKDFATLPEPTLSPVQSERIYATLPASAPGTVAFPQRRWLPVIGAVAAVLLLTVAAVHIFHRPAATTTAHLPSPQPAPVVVAQLAIPLSPLAPPADNTLTLQTRGIASRNPPIERIVPAFTAYNKADYATAEQRFAPLLTSYPHSEIVPLYLGVSRLYLHKDQQAYDVLVLAQRNANPAALATAQWYAAIAAQRLHRPEAQSLLKAVCDTPSSNFATESCHIAPTMSR